MVDVKRLINEKIDQQLLERVDNELLGALVDHSMHRQELVPGSTSSQLSINDLPMWRVPSRGGFSNIFGAWAARKAADVVAANTEFVDNLNDYADTFDRFDTRKVRHQTRQNLEKAELIKSQGAIQQARAGNVQSEAVAQMILARINDHLRDMGVPTTAYEIRKAENEERLAVEKADEEYRSQKILQKMDMNNQAVQEATTIAGQKLLNDFEDILDVDAMSTAGLSSIDEMVEWVLNSDIPEKHKQNFARKAKMAQVTLQATIAGALNV